MEEQSIAQIYRRNVDMVYRLCFSYMKNRDDAFDVMQTTFYKMIKKDVTFENREHEKAWLIVTASNTCKSELSHWWRKRGEIQEWDNPVCQGEDKEFLELVLSLPQKYRIPIYLHYYEGYSAVEIGRMLGKNDSTIRGYLLKGREILGKEIS